MEIDKIGFTAWLGKTGDYKDGDDVYSTYNVAIELVNATDKPLSIRDLRISFLCGNQKLNNNALLTTDDVLIGAGQPYSRYCAGMVGGDGGAIQIDFSLINDEGLVCGVSSKKTPIVIDTSVAAEVQVSGQLPFAFTREEA